MKTIVLNSLTGGGGLKKSSKMSYVISDRSLINSKFLERISVEKLRALARSFTSLSYCWIILTIPYWAILYWSARHLTKLLTGVLRQTTRGTAALKRKKGSRNFQVPFQKSQEQNSKSVIWNWIRCEPERERGTWCSRPPHKCPGLNQYPCELQPSWAK